MPVGELALLPRVCLHHRGRQSVAIGFGRRSRGEEQPLGPGPGAVGLEARLILVVVEQDGALLLKIFDAGAVRRGPSGSPRRAALAQKAMA